MHEGKRDREKEVKFNLHAHSTLPNGRPIDGFGGGKVTHTLYNTIVIQCGALIIIYIVQTVIVVFCFILNR